MIVPSRIKVGFQKREDTYTGQLGYVIYFDDKGVLRKETSWNSWRQKEIDPKEFDNEPIEGFVVNKGNTGRCYSHYDRNPFIRIYDPRNFEFEISLGNLMLIMNYCIKNLEFVPAEVPDNYYKSLYYIDPKTIILDDYHCGGLKLKIKDDGFKYEPIPLEENYKEKYTKYHSVNLIDTTNGYRVDTVYGN